MPAADDESRLTFLADRLHSLAIHLLRSLRAEDGASGLSPARLSALSVVVFRGPLRLGELAAAEGVRPPTMSRIVGALAADGLVATRTDPDDRRSVLLEATARGRRVLDDARSRRLHRLRGELADLSPAERRAVEAAVEAFAPRFGSPRHPDGD